MKWLILLTALFVLSATASAESDCEWDDFGCWFDYLVNSLKESYDSITTTISSALSGIADSITSLPGLIIDSIIGRIEGWLNGVFDGFGIAYDELLLLLYMVRDWTFLWIKLFGALIAALGLIIFLFLTLGQCIFIMFAYATNRGLNLNAFYSYLGYNWMVVKVGLGIVQIPVNLVLGNRWKKIETG